MIYDLGVIPKVFPKKVRITNYVINIHNQLYHTTINYPAKPRANG